MNIKDFKWTEKRFGTRFANILKKLGGVSKDGTDGSIEYKDDQGNVTKLVTDSTFSSLLAKNGLIEVKWQELKDKRDNGQLIPGSLYRITDYNCTTTQENTQSAGHQFDIVLLALSENKLAEEGWAMMHDNIYDVTFDDGVTKKCWVYLNPTNSCNIVDISTKLGYGSMPLDLINVNEENKTASTNECDSSDLTQEGLTYNYFQNSNLSAWKVWYCLDNDKSRFAWADDSVDEDSDASINVSSSGNVLNYQRSAVRDIVIEGENYYTWKNIPNPARPYVVNYVWTKTETPNSSSKLYNVIQGTNPMAIELTSTVDSYIPAHQGTGLENGRGVIYRLIDEFNNDIKYDFKNIQFKRKLTNGQYDANGTETWCYTLNLWYSDMCQDASIVGNIIPDDTGRVIGVYNNKFGYVTAYTLSIEGVTTFAFALGDNVILSFDNSGYFGIFSNTIGNLSYRNTIGDSFYSNKIGDGFDSNIINNDFNSNIIGNYFNNNTIGDNFSSNIVGNYFSGKTIGDNTITKNYGNNGVELATKS